MAIPLYQVDAFADHAFSGNPAAVCPLERWLPVDVMQAIAEENNLSETAFFAGNGEEYDLRWFTPATEVDLCGHATLASAHVLFEYLEPGRDFVRFNTRSGPLSVAREGGGLLMDFPVNRPHSRQPSAQLTAALGKEPDAVLETKDHYLAIYADEAVVRDLRPDMPAVARLDRPAVIATAPGTEVDFVSRFFAPRKGVPEDPVTGSAHCVLTPYWADRLGRSELSAMQVSRRGGRLRCRLEGDRVGLWGKAVLYMRGSVNLDAATSLDVPG